MMGTLRDWRDAVLLNLGLLLTVVLVVAAVGWYRERSQTIQWVGHKELEIEFVVTDADGGRPIPQATISIPAEKGGFCGDDRDEKRFTLTTDTNGVVKQSCGLCMCFGTKGPNVDTFATHLPYWWFQASAPGYSTSQEEYIDEIEYRRLVRRGETVARLTVTIALRKAGPQPGR